MDAVAGLATTATTSYITGGVALLGGIGVAASDGSLFGNSTNSSVRHSDTLPLTPPTSQPQRVASIKDDFGTTTQTFEYDASGNVVKQTSWDSQYKEYDTTIYKYDASGHMTSSEVDNTGHDGTPDERIEFTADANGNILTEKVYDTKTGYIQKDTVNIYDSHGNILSSSGTTYYQKEDDLTKFNTTYKNTYDGDKLVQVDINWKIGYVFENLEGIRHMGEASEQEATIKYTYNDDGLLIRKQELSGYGTLGGQPAETENYTPVKGYGHEDSYSITYKDGVISEVEHFSRDTDVMHITKTIYTHEAGKSSTVYAEEFLGYKQDLLPAAMNNIIKGTESYDAPLNGTNGNDTIYGLGGDDFIDGGDGHDTLSGGADKDIFSLDYLYISNSIDIITDFTVADDKIILLAAELTSQLGRYDVLSADIFKANTTGTATDSDDRILYNTTTGDLSYDSDGNGTGAAQVFATLSNIPTNLTYENFTLIHIDTINTAM